MSREQVSHIDDLMLKLHNRISFGNDKAKHTLGEVDDEINNLVAEIGRLKEFIRNGCLIKDIVSLRNAYPDVMDDCVKDIEAEQALKGKNDD